MARTSTALALSLLAGLALGGCGSGRSVAAYCSTFYTVGEQIRQQYQRLDPQRDLVGSLTASLAAPQEIATFFDKLDAVAPPDIEPDVKVLQGAFQKLSDNEASSATNPLGGLLQGLLLSASTSGSYNRVNAWTLQHCGPPPRDGSSTAP